MLCCDVMAVAVRNGSVFVRALMASGGDGAYKPDRRFVY